MRRNGIRLPYAHCFENAIALSLSQVSIEVDPISWTGLSCSRSRDVPILGQQSISGENLRCLSVTCQGLPDRRW